MNKFSFDDLKNKVCVITGGGGVIGNSLSMALGAAGIKLAVVDLVKEAADKTADEVKTKFNTDAISSLAPLGRCRI